jgi:hypothetical protein
MSKELHASYEEEKQWRTDGRTSLIMGFARTYRTSVPPVMKAWAICLMSAAGYEGKWQSSHLRHSVRKYMCAFTVSVPLSRPRALSLSLSPHCLGSESVRCNRSGAISDVTILGEI